MKITIFLFHPDLKMSSVNQALIKSITTEVKNIYELYPDENINIKAEQDALVKSDRIIFQYRPSIWAVLTEYMPRDMVKRLDDVIRNERGGHFRRRPGA